MKSQQCRHNGLPDWQYVSTKYEEVGSLSLETISEEFALKKWSEKFLYNQILQERKLVNSILIYKYFKMVLLRGLIA